MGPYSRGPTGPRNLHSSAVTESVGSGGRRIPGVLRVTATSSLATSMPASIGGSGPFDVVATKTRFALGVAEPVGAAYAGVVHLVALWLPVNIAGLVLAWKHHLSIRSLAQTPRPPEPEYASENAGGLAQPKEDST